jgi:hypothetical protein
MYGIGLTKNQHGVWVVHQDTERLREAVGRVLDNGREIAGWRSRSHGWLVRIAGEVTQTPERDEMTDSLPRGMK